MNYSLAKKEVKEINTNFNHYIDSLPTGNLYNTGILIYSRLTKVQNDTFYLDVFISKEWNKTPIETVYMFVNNWLYKTDKLKKCTNYKATIFTGNSLGFTLLTDKNFKEFVEFIVSTIKLLGFKKVYTQSNINKPINSLKTLLFGSNPYDLNTTIFKLLVNSDLKHHYINYNSFLRLFIYNEDYYYSNNVIGLPTILRIENNSFPVKIDLLKLPKQNNKSFYAVMIFKHTNKTYTTETGSDIPVAELKRVELYKSVIGRGVKLIAKSER